MFITPFFSNIPLWFFRTSTDEKALIQLPQKIVQNLPPTKAYKFLERTKWLSFKKT